MVLGTRVVAAALFSTVSVSASIAQERDYEAEYEAAVASAKEAAGFEWLGTFNRLCVLPPTRGPLSTSNEPAAYVTDPSSAPAREDWYAEGRQFFDDLYWLGGKQHSAWLITDPEGHILIDTEYPYNSEELILGAMEKLDLDPTDIKYIIISQAHGDHIGGVQIVQDATEDGEGNKAKVVMGAADWEMVDAFPGRFQGMMPDQDPELRIAVPQLGQLDTTVGSHTVTSYSTPPHSPGTISHLFTVHDFGRPVVVSFSGGTAYNFQTDQLDPGMENLQTYLDGVEKFAKISADAGATVLMSNHNEFDRAWDRSRMLADRGFGPHPFELGEEWVQRYYDVMGSCTKAKMIKLEQASNM